MSGRLATRFRFDDRVRFDDEVLGLFRVFGRRPPRKGKEVGVLRETADKEIKRLQGERRHYELMLAGTPESQRDRRAHLQDWMDRRTAEINKLHDRRPLGLWSRVAAGAGAIASLWGFWEATWFWPKVALAVLALFLAEIAEPDMLTRRTRQAARKLTRRARRDNTQPPRCDQLPDDAQESPGRP